MKTKTTVVLVGDVVDERRYEECKSPFDEDRPWPSEIVDLRGWLEDAGYGVEVHSTVRGFLVSAPQIKTKDVVVFPLWRGGLSRNRTAVVPAVCEDLGIPYIGGDTLVQSVCQDKSLSKLYARTAGFHVPDELPPLRSPTELASFRPTKRLTPPFVVKPLYSAASLGVNDRSMCWTDRAARRAAADLFDAGLGPVLCEEFVDGDEISLCLIEERGAIVERCAAGFFDAKGRCPFKGRLFTFDDKMNAHPPWTVGVRSKPLGRQIWNSAHQLVKLLGKVDYMRVDFRIRAERAVVIELTPDIHLGLVSSFLGGFNAAGRPPASLLRRLVQASLANHETQPTEQSCSNSLPSRKGLSATAKKTAGSIAKV